MLRNAGLTIFAAIALVACNRSQAPASPAAPSTAEIPSEINVYSARHYDSDKALYARFEAVSGIKVKFRESGAPELLEAMKAEGAASPADLIIASDAGTLYRFKSAGLTQPAGSAALETAIPAGLRDPEGHWFGLARRARVIAYDPARVTPDQVDEYTDLASAALVGKVCMRSSTNIYNLSLMGELIGRLGADGAGAWARSVVANFARPPQGGDTTQLEGIAAGECAVAVVNHYYWVRLATGSQAERATAAKSVLSFPGQSSTGTHVNITAAAVSATARNKAGAVQLIEWLATPEGQAMLTTETKEMPILAGAVQPEGLSLLPQNFKASDFPLSDLGPKQAEAQTLYDTAGWN
jgi:iron(III) transport system substrate-binding protein